MDELEFRMFLDLLMCSDPWPINDRGYWNSQEILTNYADRVSQTYGFENWINAYHKL